MAGIPADQANRAAGRLRPHQAGPGWQPGPKILDPPYVVLDKEQAKEPWGLSRRHRATFYRRKQRLGAYLSPDRSHRSSRAPVPVSVLSDQSLVLAMDEIEHVEQGPCPVLALQHPEAVKDARELQVVVVGGRQPSEAADRKIGRWIQLDAAVRTGTDLRTVEACHPLDPTDEGLPQVIISPKCLDGVQLQYRGIRVETTSELKGKEPLNTIMLRLHLVVWLGENLRVLVPGVVSAGATEEGQDRVWIGCGPGASPVGCPGHQHARERFFVPYAKQGRPEWLPAPGGYRGGNPARL
jgi:hypothetical protein